MRGKPESMKRKDGGHVRTAAVFGQVHGAKAEDEATVHAPAPAE
jgi:hypothetical protein